MFRLRCPVKRCPTEEARAASPFLHREYMFSESVVDFFGDGLLSGLPLVANALLHDFRASHIHPVRPRFNSRGFLTSQIRCVKPHRNWDIRLKCRFPNLRPGRYCFAPAGYTHRNTVRRATLGHLLIVGSAFPLRAQVRAGCTVQAAGMRRVPGMAWASSWKKRRKEPTQVDREAVASGHGASALPNNVAVVLQKGEARSDNCYYRMYDGLCKGSGFSLCERRGL